MKAAGHQWSDPHDFLPRVHHDIRAELAELGRHGSGIGDISLENGSVRSQPPAPGFEVAGVGQAVHHADFIGSFQ